MSAVAESLWWRRGIIYQIYPRSFQDSNGDGIGDLPGLMERLDYLTWLGVDAIWLSPIYPSPMADFGYDVSDYTDVSPVFGTLADFDRLVAESHRRKLKVLMDLVPNHTSDRHPWFQESRSLRSSPKRDWYLWRDPGPDGGPPTNWLSEFGGSAWEFDQASGQYYYHAFLKEQPDLNWRNAEVRAAMCDVLRFWFDRGVDGFRIDVVYHLFEDAAFTDNPPNPDFGPGSPPSHALMRVHTVDQPEVHDVIAEWRRLADEFGGRVLIGEIHLPIKRLVAYYGVELGGIHLPLNFNLIGARWSAEMLRSIISAYEAALPPGAWPNWVGGSHDAPRLVTRIGTPAARLAAVLLLTLRGTPTLYYGDELGMEDVTIEPAAVRDRFEKNVPGLGLGRDPARTPMCWTGGPNGGFTTGTPWLPVGDNVKRPVKHQAQDASTMLSLYRRLIALRRAEPALSVGSYESLSLDPECLAYGRSYGEERFVILLNFSDATREVVIPEGSGPARILLSSAVGRASHVVDGTLSLAAAEAVVLRLDRK